MGTCSLGGLDRHGVDAGSGTKAGDIFLDRSSEQGRLLWDIADERRQPLRIPIAHLGPVDTNYPVIGPFAHRPGFKSAWIFRRRLGRRSQNFARFDL